jgi:hypothetical protein
MLLPPASESAFTRLVGLPLRSGAVCSLASGAHALRPFFRGPSTFPPGKPHEIDRTATCDEPYRIFHESGRCPGPARQICYMVPTLSNGYLVTSLSAGRGDGGRALGRIRSGRTWSQQPSHGHSAIMQPAPPCLAALLRGPRRQRVPLLRLGAWLAIDPGRAGHRHLLIRRGRRAKELLAAAGHAARAGRLAGRRL